MPTLIGALASMLLAYPGAAEQAQSPSLLVKFRSEGPRALVECAESLTRQRRAFRPATADLSDSLDTLHRELDVRAVRAVFRRPDGSPFQLQRRRLRDRLRAARARFPGRARRAPDRSGEPPDLAHVYRVELPPGADAAQMAARYAADAHVEYAQPNYAVESDLLLNDPFLSSSGAWGQPYADLWGLLRVGAPDAWDSSLGEGVVVGVVDTGLDYRHPDIEENAWVHPGEDLNGNGAADPEEFNGIDDDGNGFVDDLRGFDFHNSLDANGDGDFDDPEDQRDSDPFDDNGHGTHVAGIAAARGGNGIGISGAAPLATVMPVKVFPRFGSAETDRVWRGVLYAAENGADVINASFSCGRRCPSNPIAEEVVQLVSDMGAILVTSAGNKVDDVSFYSPERLRETIVVGSAAHDDALSSFSNFGFLVDLVAPGGGPDQIPGVVNAVRNILSLRSSAADLWTTVVADDYLRLAGTSMAAPYVTGVVALLLSARPELSREQVRAILRLSAADRGAAGHDRFFGSGLLDAARALDMGAPIELTGTIREPRPGSTLTRRQDELAILGSASGADLLEYRVELGLGSTPDVWVPLGKPGRLPVPDGELARWPLRDFEDGRYVLRLTLEGRDGSRMQEFAPVSLDRNPPRFVSSPGPDALLPVVSGKRVVWQSRRVCAEGEAEACEDLDLFASRFDAQGEVAVTLAPGDQLDAAVSGALVAWRDGRSEALGPHEAEIRICRMRSPHGACEEELVAEGPAERGPPDVSSEGLIYEEIRAESAQLALCEFSAGSAACANRHRIPLESRAPAWPQLDGRRLLWRDTLDGAFRFFTCLLDPVGGACPTSTIEVTEPTFFPEKPRLSKSLLAFPDLFGLILCELDPETGTCGALVVDSALTSGLESDLSDGRLVWHRRTQFDDFDVFLCQYDPVLKRCPVQRITSDAAAQSHPRIDGRRVVWQDDREGAFRIAALELPTLDRLRDRTVAEGHLLSFPVRGDAPDGRVVLGVRTADGEGVEILGARLLTRGARQARFRWRPRSGQAGAYEFIFRATGGGGLYAEQTVRVQVREPRPRPRRPQRRLE
jgi:beta propeller repeat protein